MMEIKFQWQPYSAEKAMIIPWQSSVFVVSSPVPRIELGGVMRISLGGLSTGRSMDALFHVSGQSIVFTFQIISPGGMICSGIST